MPQNQPILTKILLDDAEFKKAMGGIQGQLQTMGSRFSKIGRDAAVPFAALGTTVLGAAKSFGDFQASMSNVSTLIDTNTESMSKMGKEVLDIAKKTPVAIGDLSSSLYDVRSAGIEAGKAMGVLETSAKLSVAGLSTSAESTNIMTSALNAFKAENLSADQTANILFKTVKFGKTTISELAQAFGTTAPIVQAAGITLDDFSAATAALTTVGTPAAQAQNSLRAAVVALQKPTKEMSELFEYIGVSSGEELIQTSNGIGDAFSKISQASAESGINLSKAASSVEASNAIISLAGSTNEAYVTTLASMRDGTDEVTAAFEKQKGTFNSTIKLLMNNVQALAISFGEGLAPTISVAANAISAFAGLVANVPKPIQQIASTALLAATAVTGLIFVVGISAGTFATGAASVLSMATVLQGALANAAASASASFVSMGVALGVGTGGLTWIITGAVAAVAALAVAWNNDFMGIKGITEKVVYVISGLWGNFIADFKQLIETAKLVWKDFTSYIGPIIKDSLDWIGKQWEGLTGWINDGLTNLKSWFHSTWVSIQKSAFESFGGTVEAGKSAFAGLVNLGKAMADSVAAAFRWMAGQAAKAFDWLIDKTNAALSVAGLPTIQKMGDVAKASLGGAADYVSSKWAQAAASIRNSVVAARKPINTENNPKTDPNADLENRNASGGGSGGVKGKKGKKEKDTHIQDEMRSLKILTDELSNSLSNNSLALRESTANLGAYANEGQKLSLQLEKLKSDEEALLNARAKVSSMNVDAKKEHERLQALQDINEKIRANHIERKELENDYSKFAVEQTKKITTERNKILDAHQALENKRLEMSNQFKKRQDDIELQSLKRQLDQKQISREAYLNQTNALYEEQAQRELDYTTRQIEQMKLKHEQMLLQNGTTAESLLLMQQIEEMEYRLMEIELQKNQMIMQNQQMVNDGQTTLLENMMNYATQFGENFVQSILSGNQSIGDSFKALGVQILNDLAKNLFKKVADHFKEMLKNGTTTTSLLQKGFQAFSKASSSIFGGLFSVINSIFGGMFSFIINGLRNLFTRKKKGAVGDAKNSVIQGALNTAKESANAPFPLNLVLPQISYSMYMGAFMPSVGLIAGTPSFAVGTPNVSEDMLANIHKGEMIIPATFAQGIRSGEITLSGGKGNAQPAQNITNINFDGAQFYGTSDEMIAQIEQKLNEKFNIMGSPLQQSFA